jgi:hypothetical protein
MEEKIMSYKKIPIASATPHRVKELVRHLEDLYLRDVHCMLRLPQPDSGLSAGCNFAITQVLLSVISGVSSTLYPLWVQGQGGKNFKKLLVDCYPWDLEPSQVIAPSEAASDLYYVFRNPLAHDLGLNLEGKKAKTPKVLIKRLRIKKTCGLSEEKIEEIENTNQRFLMSDTLTIDDNATVLLVEALYWGVRVMVGRLTRDAERMLSGCVSFMGQLPK